MEDKGPWVPFYKKALKFHTKDWEENLRSFMQEKSMIILTFNPRSLTGIFCKREYSFGVSELVKHKSEALGEHFCHHSGQASEWSQHTGKKAESKMMKQTGKCPLGFLSRIDLLSSGVGRWPSAVSSFTVCLCYKRAASALTETPHISDWARSDIKPGHFCPSWDRSVGQYLIRRPPLDWLKFCRVYIMVSHLSLPFPSQVLVPSKQL